MNRKARTALVAAAVAAAAAGGTAIAGATSGDRDTDEADRPIRGSDLERASAAALEHTGGGRVTETEVGDEEGAYEVEVTKADGGQVDVHLDSAFNVIGEEADREEPGDR